MHLYSSCYVLYIGILTPTSYMQYCHCTVCKYREHVPFIPKPSSRWRNTLINLALWVQNTNDDFPRICSYSLRGFINLGVFAVECLMAPIWNVTCVRAEDENRKLFLCEALCFSRSSEVRCFWTVTHSLQFCLWIWNQAFNMWLKCRVLALIQEV